MDVIKNDKGTNVGDNIRRIRLESDIGQTDLVRILQLMGADITREALVKIEKGTQHIKVSQLKAIKAALGNLYEDLLNNSEGRTPNPRCTALLACGQKNIHMASTED